jgi:hypothetical protein
MLLGDGLKYRLSADRCLDDLSRRYRHARWLIGRSIVSSAHVGQKSRYVPVVESVVDSATASTQKKKPNDIWSEWQDLNLRPLRPERSALPG